MRFLASVFVAALLAATQASAKPEAIEFSDLVDPLAIVFDDPYRDMGFQLLNELKLVVELDEKLAQKDLAEDERARLTARRSAAKDMLEINGQDVDALLAQRWDVAKKRQTARSPRRWISLLLRHRYLALAAILNLPGNAVIGGAGGIGMIAGLSRAYTFPRFLILMAVSTLPVPLFPILTGGA